MKDGLGIFLWKISVALYLIANGVLGLLRTTGGDFDIIFRRFGFGGDTLNLFIIIAGVIALVAGAALLLEMLNIKIPMLNTLIFIIALIWVVYVIVGIISWIMGGFNDIWNTLQRLAVHIMVLASLMIASKKFS